LEVKGNYDERQRAFASEQRKGEMNLSLYARLFQLGCKFDVPLLRAKSIELFQNDADKRTLYYRDIMRAVHVAFHTGSDTESQMRDCTFNTLLTNIRKASEFDWVAEEIQNVPGLAIKLIVAMAKKM
jgi:hypothetical protein